VYADENDISAQKEIQSKGSWLQSQNEQRSRKKSTGFQKNKRKKTAFSVGRRYVVYSFPNKGNGDFLIKKGMSSSVGVKMERFVSLKKNDDFGRVYRQGKSYGNKILVMYILERGQDQENRIGISVSKKVGNSVVRHRVKRLIKESFRTHLEWWRTGYDIIIIARQDAKDKDYHKIESALLHLGKHHNIVDSEGENL